MQQIRLKIKQYIVHAPCSRLATCAGSSPPLSYGQLGQLGELINGWVDEDCECKMRCDQYVCSKNCSVVFKSSIFQSNR